MNDASMEIEAIKRLKARYFRYLDTKRWSDWREIFTDDMEGRVDRAVSTEGGDGATAVIGIGGDSFVDAVRKSVGACITVHHGHMPEIELTSAATASGIWAMEDIVEWPDGRKLKGYGHYYETYRKVNGAWRIASLHLRRIRIDESLPSRTTSER